MAKKTNLTGLEGLSAKALEALNSECDYRIYKAGEYSDMLLIPTKEGKLIHEWKSGKGFTLTFSDGHRYISMQVSYGLDMFGNSKIDQLGIDLREQLGVKGGLAAKLVAATTHPVKIWVQVYTDKSGNKGNNVYLHKVKID